MKMPFAAWMKAVDATVWRKYGLSVYDLDDAPFADWWSNGMKAVTAANKAARMAGASF